MKPILTLTTLLLMTASHVTAQQDTMTPSKLLEIVTRIDPDARLAPNGAQLTLQDIPITVIFDETADRMRAIVPIRSADGLDHDELQRLMQANFDTALDARYAIARGRLWATFIHPLSPLEHEQLLSALVQTINLARTYGSAYSGGAAHFGPGDSGDIYRDLLNELLERGQEL